MLAPCGDQAGDGSAEVTFPGDGAVLGEHAIPDAAEGESNEESDEEGTPTAHEDTCEEEVGDQAVDDGAGSDMDTIWSADEPGSEAADEPDGCEREAGFIAVVPEEERDEDEERYGICEEVQPAAVEQGAEDDAHKTLGVQGADSEAEQVDVCLVELQEGVGELHQHES